MQEKSASFVKKQHFLFVESLKSGRSPKVESKEKEEVGPLRCGKLDRCAVGSWTAALLDVGPLRCWMLDRCAVGSWNQETRAKNQD